MVQDFREFLISVKQIGGAITALSGERQAAERLILHSHTLNGSQEIQTIVLGMRDISKTFYQSSSTIKKDLEQLASTSTDALPNKNKEAHITALFNRLFNQTCGFAKLNSKFSEIVEEREKAMSTLTEYTSAEALASPTHSTLPHTGPLESTFPGPMNSQETLQQLLTDITNLEMLTIELNAIVQSTGDNIDKVSLKFTESKNLTTTINMSIERGIFKRRRRRRMKQALMFFLGVALLLLVSYVGTYLLDMIVKLRKATK